MYSQAASVTDAYGTSQETGRITRSLIIWLDDAAARMSLGAEAGNP